jgi:hypothetical protein
MHVNQPEQEPNMTAIEARIARNNARIAMLTEILTLRQENAAMKNQARKNTETPKAKKAAPAWIVARAVKAAPNKPLAEALRAHGKSASGTTWTAAKALLAQGFSVQEAAAMVVEV